MKRLYCHYEDSFYHIFACFGVKLCGGSNSWTPLDWCCQTTSTSSQLHTFLQTTVCCQVQWQLEFMQLLCFTGRWSHTEEGATEGPDVVTHSPWTLLGYTAGERRHTKGWPNRFVKFCKKKEKTTKLIGRSRPTITCCRRLREKHLGSSDQSDVTAAGWSGNIWTSVLNSCGFLWEGDFLWKQRH